jgi:hypothetical protein
MDTLLCETNNKIIAINIQNDDILYEINVGSEENNTEPEENNTEPEEIKYDCYLSNDKKIILRFENYINIYDTTNGMFLEKINFYSDTKRYQYGYHSDLNLLIRWSGTECIDKEVCLHCKNDGTICRKKQHYAELIDIFHNKTVYQMQVGINLRYIIPSNHNELIIVHWENYICIWNPLINNFRIKIDTLCDSFDMCLSNDNKYIYVSWANGFKIYDYNNGELLYENGYKSALEPGTIICSSNGEYLARNYEYDRWSDEVYHGLQLIRLSDKKCIYRSYGNLYSTSCINFSKCNKYFIYLVMNEHLNEYKNGIDSGSDNENNENDGENDSENKENNDNNKNKDKWILVIRNLENGETRHSKHNVDCILACI